MGSQFIISNNEHLTLFFWGVTMKIELRETEHLWITYNPAKGDHREIIIDREKKNIRICDGASVIKVRFDEKGKIKDVLVDDIFVYPAPPYPSSP